MTQFEEGVLRTSAKMQVEINNLQGEVGELQDMIGELKEMIKMVEMVGMMKDVVEGLTKCDVPWECETLEARKKRKEKELDEWRSKQDYPDFTPARPDGWDGFRSKGDNDDLHGHPRW